MIEFDAKFQVKVRTKTDFVWTHFAYCNKELYDKFRIIREKKGYTNLNWLEKWSNEWFGIKRIDTWDDLNKVRKCIRDYYRELYPQIHLQEDDGVDRLGWTKFWLMDRMKEEVDKNV